MENLLITPKLLQVGPTAHRLRVPLKWLKAEAEANRVPHLKCGNVFLFDPAAVENVLLNRANLNSDYLTPEMVDLKLNWPPGTASKMAGDIPQIILPNGDVRIERADLDRFMAENKWGGGGMNRGA